MEALVEFAPEEIVQIVGWLYLQLYRQTQEARKAKEEAAKLLEQLAQERAEKERALLWKESHDRLAQRNHELTLLVEELRGQLARLYEAGKPRAKGKDKGAGDAAAV